MKLTALDCICLGGSLAAAVAWRAFSGDAEAADRLGLALMMSWAILQSIRFFKQRTQ
jgi:hypothetical protein